MTSRAKNLATKSRWPSTGRRLRADCPPMTTFRKRATLTALIAVSAMELVLIALNYFFHENNLVQGATVVLNLPGEIAVALFLMFAVSHLPPQMKHLDVIMLSLAVVISIGTWTALASFIFRKDRSDAWTAWYEALDLDKLTIAALTLFLATGIWFCLKMSGDDDATGSAILCGLALCFVIFARRRAR